MIPTLPIALHFSSMKVTSRCGTFTTLPSTSHSPTVNLRSRNRIAVNVRGLRPPIKALIVKAAHMETLCTDSMEVVNGGRANMTYLINRPTLKALRYCSRSICAYSIVRQAVGLCKKAICSRQIEHAVHLCEILLKEHD